MLHSHEVKFSGNKRYRANSQVNEPFLAISFVIPRGSAHCKIINSLARCCVEIGLMTNTALNLGK